MTRGPLFVFWRVEGSGIARLEFGRPILPESSPEARVRWILEDYASRRDELWLMGHSIAVGVLVPWLSAALDDDPLLLPLIRAAGFVRSVSGSEHLARFLGHPDKRIRIAAITSIGQLGAFTEMALVRPLLASPDPEVRRAAFGAACQSVNPSDLARLGAVAGADPEMRERLRQAQRRMAAISARSPKALVSASLDTPDYEDLLGLLQATWEQLLAFLGDRRRRLEVRRRALRLLALPPIGKSRKQLLELMLDEREPQDLRREAVRAIGRCRALRAFDPLVRTLRSREPGFREAAVISLGHLGIREAAGPLLTVWDSSSPDCRAEIRLALRRLCNIDGAAWLEDRLCQAARATLEDLHFIQLTDGNLRLSRTLGDDACLEQLRSPQAAARREMALLLAQAGYPHHTRWLEAMAEEDEDEGNRHVAALAIRRMPALDGRRRPGRRRPPA